MAELMYPDIGGNALNAFLQGKKDRKQSRLAELASQAYSAPSDQQQQLIGQAIGLDPTAGFGLDKSLGDSRQQQLGELAQAAGVFVSAPDEQKMAMYPQLAQRAHQLRMPVPTTYDPRMLPMIEKLANGPGAGQEMKSLVRGANGNYWAIRNGQFVDTGTPYAPDVAVRDQAGVPFDLLNKRTGQSIYDQPQAQAAPSGQVQTPAGSVYIDPSIPANERAAIAANPGQFVPIDQGGTAQSGMPTQLPPVVQDGQPPMPQQQSAPQPSGGALPPPLDYQNGGQRPPMRPAVSPAEQQRLDLAAQASRRADEASKRAAEIASRGAAPAGQRFRADGSLEDIPGARQPAAATGAETQKQAVYAKNMAEDALAFAASFTGLPIDQLRAMSPEQVREAMISHDRMTAGPVMGSLPGMGKFANADLEAYSNSAAGKQARINNPTGPVTNADFEVARKSVFSSDKPRKVNADLIYEALVRARNAGTVKPQPAAPSGWSIQKVN